MKVIPEQATKDRNVAGSESRIPHTRKNRCRVCGGAREDPTEQGKRCWGFQQGDWINCTREEYAGQAKFNERSGTYAHRASGPCPCGQEHAPADAVRARPKKRQDCVYDYYDADGRLLYQTVRNVPKDFRQRRPDGDGGWIWNLNGVERVLYKLPEILEADLGQTVWICEGEKDANNLFDRGLLATTCPMGAGKWGLVDASPLKDRPCIIIPDNDDAGRSHAQQVAASLSGQASVVKILELPDLPEKGDVSDFIDRGGTTEELRQLADGVTAWMPNRNGTADHQTLGLDDPGANSASDITVSAGQSPAPEFMEQPRAIAADLIPVKPFDPAIIPDRFRPWLEDIAQRGCFPLEYPTAAAFVGLSGLVGRRLAIRSKRHDDWLVVPNLWGAIVGRPGIQKSPSVTEAFRPLKRLCVDARDEHQQALEEYDCLKHVAAAKKGASKKALEEAARKKNASDTKLMEMAREISADEHIAPPVERRYHVNDVTIEKLGELLAANPYGLLLYRDELVGFFKSLQRDGHQSDRAFFMEAWNGDGDYTFDRIGRGTLHIPNTCLAIFGTIQPGPLAKYLRAYMSGEEADGFVPRFQVLMYPDPPADFTNIDRYPETEAKNAAYAVFQAISQLEPEAMGCQVDKDRGIPYLQFSPEAQEYFDEWRSTLEKRLRSGTLSTIMENHLSKYRSLMPSLALLFHLIEFAGRGQLQPIPFGFAMLAAQWCDLLESHACRVYQSAMDGDIDNAVTLSERIKQSLPNPFTYRQVAQKGWSGLGNVDQVKQAVGILEDRGWVKVRVEAPSGDPSDGGRPSEKVYIHPKVFGEGKDMDASSVYKNTLGNSADTRG